MYSVLQLTKSEGSEEFILGDASQHEENRPPKKRNRVLLSCIPCHDLRRKCDRKRPCTRCSDHGVAGTCVYQLEDPAISAGDQDELTRLRRRVQELEHTVRVLMSRPPHNQPAPQPGSSHPPGSAESDGASPGVNIPGQSRPGSQSTSPHGSPSSGNAIPGSIGHCGCALTIVGNQILSQLLTALTEALTRLKALPEHQRLNVVCPLYVQIIHLNQHLLQAIGNNPLQQAVYPGGPPQQSYGLESPQARSASSPSSASPPQTLASDFMTFNQQDANLDLSGPAAPYPYHGSHSNSLPQSLSRSLSHHHGSSGTTSHGQPTLSYTLGAPGLSSSPTGYPQYQPVTQPVQQYATALPSVPRAGPSSSVQGSSLSAWNLTGSSSAAAQPLHRSSSKSTRYPSTRPAK